MSSDRFRIFDTTLRDGEQSPGCSMFLDEKIKMARQLERLGVDVIEAGFPIASEGDFQAVRAVSEVCTSSTIAALCRTVEGDVVRAADALKAAHSSRIHTFVATSDIHLEFKLQKSRSDVLRMTKDAVRLASDLADEVEFSAEDATRSDPEFLCEIFEAAIGAGATIINVPDTVGYTLPTEFSELVRKIKTDVVGDQDVTISVHCHNDLGLAVANSLAAIEAGARQVECTINGIGERAGNASLEEVVMACNVRGDRMAYTNNIDTTQLYPTSELLSSIISFGVQPNKAIVGRNAFAHEAGIHQHGVLSNPLCYEIMTPESVGVPKNDIVLGKHSGRHALLARYDQLGFQFGGEEISEIYERFTALADRKKNIYDQDLLALIPSQSNVAVAIWFMKIAVLPGDGIGPEVTRAAVRVLTEVGETAGISIETTENLIGGIAIRETGSPFPGETAAACQQSQAVLLGAVGDPAFDHLKPSERPEIGLLRLRKTLGGFANLRPAKACNALIESSPLREDVFRGTDLLIVRELLGGLYFGEPRGTDEREAFNTMRYSTPEVERVARVAFEAARARRGKVTSVDKANVLETSQLWRATVERIGKEYADVEVEHMFVDACAMHLVTDPRRFDVILTENLFGDILSDEAAVLTGSLGMLASATVGGEIDLYEPVHGSAPDIAGKDIANPLGAIASVALLFRYTARHEAAADAIESAIERALNDGYRTVDIARDGSRKVTTSEMSEIITRYAVENVGVSRAYHAV